MASLYKKMPFLRLLIALITGILAQSYLHFSITILLSAFAAIIIFYYCFYFCRPQKSFYSNGFGVLSF
jgi:membrane protein DedA with SNARE-associated domain